MDKKDYTREYNRAHYKAYTVRLSLDEDAALVAYMADKSPTEEIRRLLKAELRRKKGRKNAAV